MRYLMMAGAGALALASGPAMAQDAGGKDARNAAGNFPCPHYNLEESGLRSSDVKEAMRRDEGTARDVRRDRDGPARDAMGDPPAQPGASADAGASRSRDQTSFKELAERLPVPDVSDRAVETRQGGGRADGASAEDGSDDRSGRDPATASTRDFSDIIEEGDVVPEGIRDWQDKEKWKLGAQEGQKAPREIRREARQRAERNGGDETSSTGTGSDRMPAGSGNRQPSAGQSSSSASQPSSGQSSSSATADATREERRRALAAIALLSARQAIPSARFGTYEFTIDDSERVIEISGRDTRSGNRVAVDVYPDGRIQSIDTAIALDEVPESVRSTVRDELGRLRVAHTTRSLRRDFDIYYEFAGIAESGRAVEVQIRADGSDLSVRYLDRS
jgi:hypothetical protein